MSQTTTATDCPIPAVEVLPECSASILFELYDDTELLGVHLLMLARAKQRGEVLAPESVGQLYQLIAWVGYQLRELGWLEEEPDCSLPILGSEGLTMQPIIVCVPVDAAARRGIPFTPHEGSKVIRCPRCNQEVWIGPEQQKLQASGTPVLCWTCLVDLDGEMTIVPLTDK